MISWIEAWMSPSEPVADLKRLQDKVMELVKVSGTKQNSMICDGTLNQWHFHNSRASEIEVPTLLVHGYAASSMAYYRTFDGLTEKVRDLYAIDLPSNGLSKEIPLLLQDNSDIPLQLEIDIQKDSNKFKILKTMHEEKCRLTVKQCEDYYLDSIELWRQHNGIDRFNLVGHSFGGYIAFKYAVKYPDAVEKIGLISPLGVESNIHSVNNNNGWEANMLYEMELTDPASKMYAKNWEVPKILFERQTEILRWLGPIGSRICSNYITTAYNKLPTAEYKDYVFELLYRNGGISKTARRSFTRLFTRSLLARDPIMDSIDQLRTKRVLLLYGDRDWMNSYAGYRMVELLNQKRGKGYATFDEVPSARHNLFLDNPDSFNDKLIRFLGE